MTIISYLHFLDFLLLDYGCCSNWWRPPLPAPAPPSCRGRWRGRQCRGVRASTAGCATTRAASPCTASHTLVVIVIVVIFFFRCRDCGVSLVFARCAGVRLGIRTVRAVILETIAYGVERLKALNPISSGVGFNYHSDNHV